MTVVATASNPRFTLSRVDIDRGVTTYTFDTLTDLREEFDEDTDFYFITGADALEAEMAASARRGDFDGVTFEALRVVGGSPSIMNGDRLGRVRPPAETGGDGSGIGGFDVG